MLSTKKKTNNNPRPPKTPQTNKKKGNRFWWGKVPLQNFPLKFFFRVLGTNVLKAMPVCAIASRTLPSTLVQFQRCIGLAEPCACTVCRGRGMFVYWRVFNSHFQNWECRLAMKSEAWSPLSVLLNLTAGSLFGKVNTNLRRNLITSLCDSRTSYVESVGRSIISADLSSW